MTYYDLAVAARATLERAGIAPETARLDADLLARHVLGWDAATWLSHRHESVAPDFPGPYAALVARREAREPVAYIRGVQEFWGREFKVSPAVLIPRPETELLIEVAHPFLDRRPGAIVVDVGTGSGCLAITLAMTHPTIAVHATDISSAALAIARENAVRLGVDRRIRFIQGAFMADVATPVDLIVSNPPYVRVVDEPKLPPEVRRYEPANALFSSDDGLRDTRAILRASRDCLKIDGRLAFEIGLGQLTDVEAEVKSIDGIEVIAAHNDLQGIPRVVVVRRTS